MERTCFGYTNVYYKQKRSVCLILLNRLRNYWMTLNSDRFKTGDFYFSKHKMDNSLFTYLLEKIQLLQKYKQFSIRIHQFRKRCTTLINGKNLYANLAIWIFSEVSLQQIRPNTWLQFIDDDSTICFDEKGVKFSN